MDPRPYKPPVQERSPLGEYLEIPPYPYQSNMNQISNKYQTNIKQIRNKTSHGFKPPTQDRFPSVNIWRRKLYMEGEKKENTNINIINLKAQKLK